MATSHPPSKHENWYAVPFGAVAFKTLCPGAPYTMLVFMEAAMSAKKAHVHDGIDSKLFEAIASLTLAASTWFAEVQFSSSQFNHLMAHCGGGEGGCEGGWVEKEETAAMPAKQARTQAKDAARERRRGRSHRTPRIAPCFLMHIFFFAHVRVSS